MNTKYSKKANAKLLLSGEYLVLNGAKALAIPLKFGQQMTVNSIEEKILIWESSVNGEIWFSAEFSLADLKLIKTSDVEIANNLLNILKSASGLNPDFFINYKTGLKVIIDADYPLNWGLGSSSALIYLIADWMGINEFQLNNKVSNGSGYDVACAAAGSPIFYQIIDHKPHITNARIGAAIRNHAVFAWLGNKQNSQQEVENYLKTNKPTQKQIDQISAFSEIMSEVHNAGELIYTIELHEKIISEVLNNKNMVKNRFPEFNGAIKSLGAWGGDFAMFVSEKPCVELRDELKKMGLEVMFSFDEIIKK